MTNGMFKSPVHRVLTNSEKERISIQIKKLEHKDWSMRKGKIFKKVKDYADVHCEYYQQGKRALHVAKV